MTYCREYPHAAMWDSVIDKLLDRPLPDSVSWPCVDCGEHLVVCKCLRDADAADLAACQGGDQ